MLLLNLVMRIKHGCCTWYWCHALSVSISERETRRASWSFKFSLYGGNRQTITLTVISRLLIWLRSTERTIAASSILVVFVGTTIRLYQLPMILCMWDSRDTTQHYTEKCSPMRVKLVPSRYRNIMSPVIRMVSFVMKSYMVILWLIKISW